MAESFIARHLRADRGPIATSLQGWVAGTAQRDCGLKQRAASNNLGRCYKLLVGMQGNAMSGFYCPKCGRTADGPMAVAMLCSEDACPAKIQTKQVEGLILLLAKGAGIVLGLLLVLALIFQAIDRVKHFISGSQDEQITAPQAAKGNEHLSPPTPPIKKSNLTDRARDAAPSPTTEAPTVDNENAELAQDAVPSASEMDDLIARALNTGSPVRYGRGRYAGVIQVSEAAQISGGTCRTVVLVGEQQTSWCRVDGQTWKRKK